MIVATGERSPFNRISWFGYNSTSVFLPQRGQNLQAQGKQWTLTCRATPWVIGN